MKILTLDPGTGKSVACNHETHRGEHHYRPVVTSPQALHELLV